MKNIKVKNLHFYTQYKPQKELPISKMNLTILILALTFASISILINRPYMSLFAQLLEAWKGLINSIEDFSQYDQQIQSNSLIWPFQKVVHRGKVTNYRDVRTKDWQEISSDLKISFPQDPMKYINQWRNLSPYSPPQSSKEEFLLYKRLFTTLWNWGYSCDLTKCQRWDQTKGEHEWVDIVMPLNAPIQSISNGIVIEKNGNSSPYLGNYIVVLTKIDDQYYGIYYGHMSKIAENIKEGTLITRWTVIGYVGNTGKSFGSHLHLQINKLWWEPLNKLNLAKQLSKIWTDKSVSNPIVVYSVDPLRFIQQHLSTLESSNEQLSKSIKKLEKTISNNSTKQVSPPNTQDLNEDETTVNNNTSLSTSPSQNSSSIADKITLSYLPTEPVVNYKLTINILGSKYSSSSLLLKIYTPEGKLQKKYIDSIPAKIDLMPTKAGYYLISIYDGNKKLAKDKIKVKAFKDISPTQNFNALNYLFNNGIVQGYQGKLNPDQSLTRAQLTSILMRAIYQWDPDQLAQQMKDYIQKNGPFFEDVKGDEWFAPRAYMAYKLWYLKGEDGKFYPNQNVTRAQLIAIYGRTFEKQRSSQSKLRKDVSSSDRFYKYAVAAKYENLLIHKDKNFNPNQNITRLEAFLTLYRYLKSQQKDISFSLEEINTALAY